MKKTTGILAVLTMLFAGCYAENAEDLNNCAADPAGVSYSSTVTSILAANGCTGCHSGSSPSGGVNLSIFAGVKNKVTDGRLWGAINHLSGFAPMPQGGSKLSDCDIKRLKTWMDAGAPNN